MCHHLSPLMLSYSSLSTGLCRIDLLYLAQPNIEAQGANEDSVLMHYPLLSAAAIYKLSWIFQRMMRMQLFLDL